MKELGESNKLKILLVGSLPPPYGGISVHIERLYNICLKAKINCTVLDIKEDSSAAKKGENIITLRGINIWNFLRIINILRQFNGNIIHFHVSAMNKFYLGGAMLVKISPAIPKIITIHSGKFVDSYKEGSRIKQFLVRKILYNCSHVITVNQQISDFLIQKLGINSHKVSLISAFLPPLYPENAVTESIKNKVFELKKHVDKIAVISGTIMPHYGFHLVLDAFEKLQKQNAKLGLIFIFYNKEDEIYKKSLLNHIHRLQDIIIFDNLTSSDFHHILKLADIFIRPSTHEGASVTLQEAIYLNKQIVASDCANRPGGIITFENENVDDLEKNLLKVLVNKDAGIATDKSTDTGGQILNIYRKLAGEY